MKVSAVLFFFVLIFLSNSALAGTDDLELKLLDEKIKELTAGSTSNFPVMLLNHSESRKEISLRIITPDNRWRSISNYSSVIVEKKSSTNKIISLRIPENTKAGDYAFDVEAIGKPGNEVLNKVDLKFKVLPRYEIQIEKLKSPQYLLAGDTLSVKFLVRNVSNLDIDIDADILNNKVTEKRFLNIPMDSSILVNVPVSIQKNLSYFTQQSVTLTAKIINQAESMVTSSYSFDLLPSSNTKYDGYNRLPIKITGIFAADSRNETEKYGSMYDVRGGGILGENKQLEFHFRGPDRGGNPILGLNDEYYLKYTSNKVELVAGDYNYRLSDLTESSRSGQGIKFQLNTRSISVGSFYHMPRYFPEIKQIYSVNSVFRISDKLRFSAGYLSKEDTIKNKTDLLSFSGLIHPFRWGNAEFEISAGNRLNKTAKAVRAGLNINSSFISTHVNFTQADPNFPGYISNSWYLSSGLTANLLKKISLSLNYNINRSNLALDTLYANAPFSKNISALAVYRFDPSNSANIGFYIIGLEDQAIKPLFNYTKYIGRLSIQNRFRHFQLNMQGDLGRIENFLVVKSGDMTDFYNGYFSLRYNLNSLISASGFVNYQGGEKYQITGFNRFYYGGSFQAGTKKTSVSFDYRSNFELNEYFRERSLLSLQLHQQFNRNHVIELSANYNLAKNSLYKKDLYAQCRYIWTINMPLSKKKDVGSLSGKVTDLEGGSVEGIILKLNGNVAITDKKGFFRFPMLKVGKYNLVMNESAAGLNIIASVPGPYPIVIEPGKESSFEIALTRSSLIKGQLVIKEDEKNDKKNYYPVKEEIDKLIVEVSNGKEMFRVLTDRDGGFSFNDLRPGQWNVKIYSNGMPPGYQLEKDYFNVILEPGRQEKLEIIIHKKSRKIKLQQNFK